MLLGKIILLGSFMRNLTIGVLIGLLLTACGSPEADIENQELEAAQSTTETSEAPKTPQKPQTKTTKATKEHKATSLTGVYSVDVKIADDASSHPGKTLKNEIVIFKNKTAGYEAYVETKSPAQGSSCGLDEANIINHVGTNFTIQNVNDLFSFSCELDFKLEGNSIVLVQASDGCKDYCGLMDPFKFKSPPLLKTCDRPNLTEVRKRADDYKYEKTSSISLCQN